MSRFLTRGHPVAAAAVAAMIAGPAPHAIVVAGPAGVGKTTLALDLAAGLLCSAADRADRPCRECRGCRLVERGVHSDLHRLAPGGAGNQIKIGERHEPETGTVRRLVSDLALMPVEGGARVAIVEGAERMNDEAQSALLKTLEEPPAGVTIVLCVDGEEQLLPTVRSRCVRIRLGPVAVREIEAILADQGVADAPLAARLARLSSGRPGLARAWALAPDAVTARSEIARSILDLAAAGPAKRLAAARDLVGRARDLVRALDGANRPADPADPGTGRQARRGSKAAGDPRGAAAAVLPTTADGGSGAGDDDDADGEAQDVRAPAAERRRAVATLIAIWRDVARDLALVGLGEERRLRDPSLLDDLRVAAAAGDMPFNASPFLARLDRAGELIEGNVGPELVVDVLVLAWPGGRRAA